MAMNFWIAQERAKKKTVWMVSIFIALTFVVAYIANAIVAAFWSEPEYGQFPWVGVGFVALTFIVAFFNYMMYRSQGGGYVAESLGAAKVDPQTQNPAVKQLVNIVQEMAVAAGLPLPAIYILQNDQINAFAAGTQAENACICVTTGSMQQLNREELQAVIGHEFGHIYNADMRLSMRLSAMLMGFFIIFYVAFRMLQFGSFRSRDSKMNPILLLALVLVGAGALSWVAGKILSSMVSRQREYLADASSVQFTRNPDALVSALKKIANETNFHNMPKTGMAFSHLYFDHRTFFSDLFATHPPLKERIKALLGHTYLPE